jgi:hypothetical protein
MRQVHARASTVVVIWKESRYKKCKKVYVKGVAMGPHQKVSSNTPPQWVACWSCLWVVGRRA